ncbi:hypothetical protein SAMN05421779_102416 [Insolitispirillum peregrinum]|uniref:CDP-Glycerol:Poly(Glycerophosphate) glycerophosphotransferase n=2 Tax=Insolitispirillum peregrinum TaxID=80876 RepID=A0A1N7JQ07_9PROT|nr:hypothetical protein SAMN05421779_102416 [Insolitispirillum peregrinum]
MLCSYDITAVEQWPDDAIRWPTSVEDAHALNKALISGVVAIAGQESDTASRTAFMLAAPVLDVTVLTLCMTWLTWRRAEALGIKFRFQRPGLVRTLCEGGIMDGAFFSREIENRMQRNAMPQKHSWLRSAAHGLMTNRRPVLPWEQRTGVFNHNTMLQGMARADRQRHFTYLMTDQVFRHHRAGDLPEAPASVQKRLTEMVEALTARVLPVLEALGGGDLAPLRQVMLQSCSAFLAEVARYDAALSRAWRDVPAELWTGTGGNLMTRLLRLAVQREGGTVTGFDHGGGCHIHANLMPFQVNELAFCDRFIVDAPAKAEILSRGISREGSLDGAMPRIDATSGPRASWPFRKGQGAQPPKRVMYVTTAFVGEMQYPLQPLLPDPVYADWQGRLVDGLAGQGLEVLVKQHPEGLRRGVPLKRSQAGEFLGGRFGDVMDQADAFVLDYPATSTLWEAICSEKPVVFIDHHLAHWNPEVWQDFSARCAIVPSRMDEDGRPQVDFAEVAAALQTAPDDGGAFARKYLLAEQG